MSPQNTVGVKEKIDTLGSRITTLEKVFEKPTSDEEEKERREGLSMYAGDFRSG